ncbi:MAG: hypothetical protein HQM16_14655 [Deltaproteobacteria bacterium]|nr:hypothetical protein [Deltaproteobacteria bacterium]
MSDVTSTPAESAEQSPMTDEAYTTTKYFFNEEKQCLELVRKYDACEDSEHIDDGVLVREDVYFGVKLCSKKKAEQAEQGEPAEPAIPVTVTDTYEINIPNKIDGHDYIRIANLPCLVVWEEDLRKTLVVDLVTATSA